MIGKTISHYKILEKLGEGGMGVVYKAEDTKLKRSVALKFLPANLTRKETDKARFLREAQAAAALNHNNVCTIHEIHDEGENPFIVMEYVKGKTLRDIVRTGTTLSLQDVTNYTIQIAEALKSAHEEGIIHRDIKSENIMVTDKRQVKVMDFGLAKLRGSLKITKISSTLGTVAYMSPEHIEGRDVDARTDIFSFGVVLYEILTGQLPFKGEYDSAMMYAIVNEEPEPIEKHRSDISSELLHVLNRALEKDPEERYQSVNEMLIDLKRLKRDTDKVSRKSLEIMHPASKIAKPPEKVERKKSNIIKFVILGFAVIALIFISFFFIQKIRRETTRTSSSTHRQITFTGKVWFPTISPNADFIAYGSGGSLGGTSVFVQDVVGGPPLEVFNDKFIIDLEWSPDGSKLLISAYNDSVAGCYIVPRLGGTPRQFGGASVACWSPDGSHFACIVVGKNRIFFVNTTSGDTSSIALKGSFDWLFNLDWSPTGNFLAFLTNDKERYTIWTIKKDGKQQQKVIEDSVKRHSPKWSSGGDEIYYLRPHGQTKDLMKIKVNPATGKAKGSPIPIQTGLQTGVNFSLSNNNKKYLYTREQTYSNLWLINVEDEGSEKTIRTKQLTTGTSLIFDPSISPDGKNIVFSKGSQTQANIFVMPVEGGQIKQLTFLNSLNRSPVWAPDGRYIAFGSNQNGMWKVWRIDSKGGTPRPYENSELSRNTFFIAWSPGTDILYHKPGNRNYHFINFKTEEERPLVESDSVGWMFRPRFSPDSKQIAVHWNRHPKLGIWLISLEDSSHVILKTGFFYPMVWSSDGKWIYYYDYYKPAEILMIPAIGGESKRYVTIPIENIGEIIIHSDGKKIVCTVHETQSDIWLMENFDPEVR